MAVISVTIPDAVAGRVRAAVCARYRYSATLPDGSANPETQGQFVQRMVREFLKNAVRSHEAKVAGAAAFSAAGSAVDSEINLS